jgi:hypothetical protein
MGGLKRMRTAKCFQIFLLMLLLGCNSSGGGDSVSSQETQPVSATSGTATVLAFNDLGMHCIDREFSIFSILPPFNVVNAQVLFRDSGGNPVIMDDTEVELRYNSVSDPAGSINTYSSGKTDFWDHAAQLFGVNLQAGEGLTGLYMPADNPLNPGGQTMEYNDSHEWFSAEGLPITPLDDTFKTNTYPLMRVAAYDKTSGNRIGYLDVVVPVASETDCQNCHVTGRMAAGDSAIRWSDDADPELQSKKNILILHDEREGTQLSSSTPVLCSRCHYSPPLDLSGAGPTGDQRVLPTFSGVMHGFHGGLVDNLNNPVFPNDAPVEDTCYQCHPGQITQCQRGAMKTGGIDCNNCHGGMLSVGGEYPLLAGGSLDGANDGGARRPWMDLPRCQSCHTGDAVSHLSGTGLVPDSSGIRLVQTYSTGDSSASPLLTVNKRFAEQDDTLFRNSKGHGGLACEACHGSTHAIWPNADDAANDNVAAMRLQGFAGTIIECNACHSAGSLPMTTNGPHGLHNINDPRWIDEVHGEIYGRNKNSCKACHGNDLRGTVLARIPVARSFRVEDNGTVSFVKGELVGCGHCHRTPAL